jgi:hypothetical protein
LGRQELRALETSLHASPFWNMIPDAFSGKICAKFTPYKKE